MMRFVFNNLYPSDKHKDSAKPYVEMHCYNGKVINLVETDDILYTLENCACDDWEIVDDYHATKER